MKICNLVISLGGWCKQVKKGVDDRPILQFVHGLYHDLGVQDLTVQIDYEWAFLICLSVFLTIDC